MKRFARYVDDVADQWPDGLVIIVAIIVILSGIFTIAVCLALLKHLFGDLSIVIAGCLPFIIAIILLWRGYRRWLAQKISEEIE